MKTLKNVFNDTLLRLISGNIHRFYPACRSRERQNVRTKTVLRQGVSCMSLPIQKKKKKECSPCKHLNFQIEQ